VCSG